MSAFFVPEIKKIFILDYNLAAMKKLLSIIILFISFISTAQSVTPKFLDSTEVSSRYNEDVLRQYAINYPIYRVYEFTDILGKHELVLTEKPKNSKDVDSIRAFCFLIEKDSKKLEWKLNDFIATQTEAADEKSIWFWTKYLRLEDLDDNGIIDPIIVYGTAGQYGTEDGRLKILIYLNGQKHGIRHQNSGMDFGRNTRVDKSFYNLSQNIQHYVYQLMRVIYDSGKIIFPAGWEENMKLKKTYFDEN